jgi:L-lactate dehydrogenase complex protein LldF
MNAAQEFLRNAVIKSADAVHRVNLRKRMDQSYANVTRGRTRYADWEAARQRCHEIKWEAVNHLDRYLVEFEEKLKARGGHVYWAQDAAAANAYITGLARERGVHTVVKSKSMVAEEIHLAAALEKDGIEVLETDLGEFIVQLRNEPPYHILAPAMHLTQGDIAALFKDKLRAADEDMANASELVGVARQWLRRSFFKAEMGITGANFLVADSGAIAITTNEGNADLGMSLPRIHVAIVGIEKAIPRMEDLAYLWPVVATAATGQAISCYNTLIGGPRGANEIDGPEEFHVVLLDNGRSELLADPEQRDVLHCIRCGACLNACPVFRTVGGHTYGTTYPGPIGSVLTPHLRGLDEFQHLSYASSLCGACTDVCPVKIDLHHHLLHNRRNAVEKAHRPWMERVGFKVFGWAAASAGRFAFLGAVGRRALRMAYALGMEGTALDPLGPWTKYRAAPKVPAKSFRARWRDERGAA